MSVSTILKTRSEFNKNLNLHCNSIDTQYMITDDLKTLNMETANINTTLLNVSDIKATGGILTPILNTTTLNTTDIKSNITGTPLIINESIITQNIMPDASSIRSVGTVDIPYDLVHCNGLMTTGLSAFPGYIEIVINKDLNLDDFNLKRVTTINTRNINEAITGQGIIILSNLNISNKNIIDINNVETKDIKSTGLLTTANILNSVLIESKDIKSTGTVTTTNINNSGVIDTLDIKSINNYYSINGQYAPNPTQVNDRADLSSIYNIPIPAQMVFGQFKGTSKNYGANSFESHATYKIKYVMSLTSTQNGTITLYTVIGTSVIGYLDIDIKNTTNLIIYETTLYQQDIISPTSGNFIFYSTINRIANGGSLWSINDGGNIIITGLINGKMETNFFIRSSNQASTWSCARREYNFLRIS